MTVNPITKKLLNDTIIQDISDAVESIKNGEVRIKVNNKRIVQLEIIQHKDFNDVWRLEGGGGI